MLYWGLQLASLCYYVSKWFGWTHNLVFPALSDTYNSLQTNTFQGVIITDTFRTYYVFTYVCGEMEWSGLGSETAIVGFNSNADYFDNHPLNGLPDIHQLISCSGATNQRNGGEANQLPIGTTIEQTRIIACMAIANADDAAIADISTFPGLDQLPGCPSTKVQLTISTEYQQFPEQTGDCYRSNSVINGMGSDGSPFEFSTVCCYASNG